MIHATITQRIEKITMASYYGVEIQITTNTNILIGCNNNCKTLLNTQIYWLQRTAISTNKNNNKPGNDAPKISSNMSSLDCLAFVGAVSICSRNTYHS
jgi:hypothetical protein